MSPAAEKAAATRTRVKYIAAGAPQHTRIITRKEADAAGFDLAEDARWDVANRHTLTFDTISADTLEFFQKDPDFRVSEVAASEDKG